jgi:N-acetylneuraminic acid mutarotase
VKKPCLFLLLALCCALVLGIVGCSDLTTTTPLDGTLTTGVTIPTTATAAAGTGAISTTTTAEGAVASPSATSAGVWTELHPGGELPPGRSSQSMVFELYSGGAFVFGGSSALTYVNYTWDYDPIANAWIELDPAGTAPPPRGDFAMVYNSDRGQVILFGGGDGTAYFNDTWAYDRKLDAWTNLNPAGTLPPARSECSLAYDSVGHKMILFGGSSFTLGSLNDTWAYDPSANTWTNLSPSGSLPPGRGLGALVYDSDSGKLILFGGSAGSICFNDTWAYDPDANTWTNLSPSGSLPAARCLFSMAYDSNGGEVVLFGGLDIDRNFFNDTWAYDPSANTWTDLSLSGTVPSARTGASMVYNSLSGDLILFGGWDGESELNDTWAYRTP